MDNAKVVNKMQTLEALPPITWIDSEIVAENFINTYAQTHPDESRKACEVIYEREALFFKRILVANPKLNEARRFSLYACFMDVTTNGQTFDPGAGLMYIATRGFKVGKDDQGKDIWETRAENKLTAAGELNLRIQLGQLKYADVPVIVYDNHEFKIGFDGKNKYVIWNSDGTDQGKVKASFMKMTRPDGSVDIPYLTASDFERFAAASKRENSRGNQDKPANALYTSFRGGIDPGFASTKTMRHAFRTSPKARIIGSNTTFESDDLVDETNMVQELGNQDDAPPAGSPHDVIVMPPPFNDGRNVPGPDQNKSTGTVRRHSVEF